MALLASLQSYSSPSGSSVYRTAETWSAIFVGRKLSLFFESSAVPILQGTIACVRMQVPGLPCMDHLIILEVQKTTGAIHTVSYDTSCPDKLQMTRCEEANWQYCSVRIEIA